MTYKKYTNFIKILYKKKVKNETFLLIQIIITVNEKKKTNNK